MKTYPIKFTPILKEKIWGGNKLRKKLGKLSSSDQVGESWEISSVEGNVSTISNGVYKNLSINDLIKSHKSEFLGHKNFKTFGENFPLLVKFLDAKTNLSVQVHPDDEMAKKHHNSFGKTEMWYIMDSDADAEIILGLNDNVNDTNILKNINAKNVTEVFNTEKVKRGDSYFIPAGKVHAIGAGVLAAEIQQTSDITYRVYDWDREDGQGNKRELHTQLAQQATKKFPTNGRKKYSLYNKKTSNLATCEFFKTNIIKVDRFVLKDYSDLDSFTIFMCVEGSLDIILNDFKETINIGETVLIPANSKEVFFDSNNARVLEVYIPN